MSFYTHFLCYRAGPPPARVSGKDLGQFVRRFAQLGVTADTGGGAQIKCGNRVDQDKRPTFELVPTATAGILSARSMEWDIETGNDYVPLAEELATYDVPIYRAH